MKFAAGQNVDKFVPRARITDCSIKPDSIGHTHPIAQDIGNNIRWKANQMVKHVCRMNERLVTGSSECHGVALKSPGNGRERGNIFDISRKRLLRNRAIIETRNIKHSTVHIDNKLVINMPSCIFSGWLAPKTAVNANLVHFNLRYVYNTRF